MPRNASGIYTLPGGNPVTPGDVIEAAWANTTLEDVADALTNSLSRTGAGGMLAPFRIADGSISAPGLSYLNETNTGLYRSGSGSTWMAVLGVNVAQFSTVGLTVPFGKALTAAGNASVAGTFAVTGATTLASTLSVTGAITATGGVTGNVAGNVTAVSGTSTFNDVVITGSLDMTAGSSATITGLSTPTNASDAANKGYVDTQDALKLSLTGGTMSGNIAMGGNLVTGLGAPSAGGDATNKTYVDAQVATRLALAGGTMSGAIAMGSSKITGLGTPTADADAATKAYVDSVAQGLDVKGSCRVATVANITLSGTQTIDGVAVIAGDRVLVKDQSTAANNGIYVVAAGAWSRAADADTWNELVGAFTFVEEGTVNDNSGWVCTSPAGGTLGVTAVTWEQFSGAGQITAGAGMYKSGNTLNVGTASSSRIVVNTDDIDLATTGVTASTYKSVTVDAYGRVTAGTNPTTLAGFGITDAYTQTQVDTLVNAKLSLSGGTMTGAIAMGGFKVTGLGTPTNSGDAATKTYVDTADALKLNLTGGTMSGVIAMGANKITGLADPTLAQDAATKNYIDTIFGSTSSAAASAAAAASSASSASSSATAAASSATAAAGSATSAASSYTTFNNQYLGSKTSDPSTNNTGGALVAGNLYWNSTASEMRVYNGSAWVAAYLPASGYAQLAAANVFTANQTITANTSSDALKITQTGSGNALYIEDVAADATPFVVSSTGAVGIGTTTPDNVTSAGIALVSSNGYYPQVVNRNKTNDANASYIVFEKDRAGAIVQNGDILGNLVFRGYDGANYWQAAAIWSAVGAAPGTNDMPGDLVFGTTPDGASGITERFRIANTGAWGLSGANYGSAGQVLTSNGSGSAPSWQAAGGGGSAATPTALGTVYGNTGSGTPFNVLLGYGAGGAISTGLYHTAVGFEALKSIVTVNFNSAFGFRSLRDTTSGTQNSAVGYASLIQNTTGSYNTAVGNEALYSNTTAGWNTAVGDGALRTNTAAKNTAVGRRALYSNTTGTENVGLGTEDAGNGYGPLWSNTTGNYNIAVGNGALGKNTTASNQVAVGHQALLNATTSAQNVAVGYQALVNATTGNGSNTAVGHQALLTNNTGDYNVAVGISTMRFNTTGTANTGVGTTSLFANTTGGYNTGLGQSALQSNTTASNNTAVGYKALFANTTALYNVAVGSDSLVSSTTGTSNTAIGTSASLLNTTGNYNVSVGMEALRSNTTANYNVAVGYQALYQATGVGSIGIGVQAGYALTTGTYGIYIGYGANAGASSSANEIVIGNAGNLSITGKGSNTAFISANGGSSYNGANTTTWATTSDQRIKKNIVDVANGLGVITALRPVEFDYKENDKHEVGFIAQEYAQVLPDQIIEHDANPAEKEWVGDDKVKAIQQNLVPYLVKAIQELKAEFDAYKATHP